MFVWPTDVVLGSGDGKHAGRRNGIHDKLFWGNWNPKSVKEFRAAQQYSIIVEYLRRVVRRVFPFYMAFWCR